MASSSQNQQTTANRGGASSIATPANSGGSGLFGGGDVGAAHKTSGDATSDAREKAGGQSAAGAKRHGSDMFGNLSNLKRNSTDRGAQARKTSLTDQHPQPGVMGKMWNSITKGDPLAEK